MKNMESGKPARAHHSASSDGGRFFDIQPAEKPDGSRPGFLAFFWVAFFLFLLLSVAGIITAGKTTLWEGRSLASSGVNEVIRGAEALARRDFERAVHWFEGAERSFQALSDEFGPLGEYAEGLTGQGLLLESADGIVQGGRSVSRIGRDLSEFMKEARAFPEIFFDQNQGVEGVSLTEAIRSQKSRLESILAESALLQKHLKSINLSVLPGTMGSRYRRLRDEAGVLLGMLREADSVYRAVLDLLGDEVPHRYLVIFQNNRERRATGGFIGSYAIVDVNDGVITKTEVKDVYESDGHLTEKLPAPPGIDQVADRLYMRDANYSPDFPTSARMIKRLLEHSRGPSVDTVIAIDQTVAEALLELTGPVASAGFPFVVTADTFNDLFSFTIESKLSVTATPKQILLDFIPIFREKLLETRDPKRITEVLAGLVRSRHIQVYSDHYDIRQLATALHMDGAMTPASPDVDFFALVTTSIGGNKSDFFVETEIEHRTEMKPGEPVEDQVIMTRVHTWEEEDFAFWKKMIDRHGSGKLDEKSLKKIHGGGSHKDFARVYIPLGSRLTKMEGVDPSTVRMYEELGYTVIAFLYGPIAPGELKTVKIRYQLPDGISAKARKGIYRFIGQKQAGADNLVLKKSIRADRGIQVTETYPPPEKGPFTIYPTVSSVFDTNQIFLAAWAKE